MLPESDFLGLLFVTAGVGGAMVWVAARYRLLEGRSRRRCPACGRYRTGARCGC